jgi:hypothetical protein
MNLVNTIFIYSYYLIMYPLSEIGFSGLAIHYTNNREILIHHFINLEVDVKGI